ncbi:MAG TPA: UDP-N-acetylmuramate dehydrogenase [Candidatus Sumerlaeia bacterium]|nr:UDP-N-acetylmuramate dehydrogenase [Candidatus Sumerlaeia bacterium]
MTLTAEILMELEDIACRKDQPLARHTSMQVGGPAAILAEPEERAGLALLLQTLHERRLPFYMLGSGTNVLFGDEGFHGVVIKLGEDFRFIRRMNENDLEVGAATPLTVLVGRTIDLGLMGLEFCQGIPGTVGGAAAGNAGRDGIGIHDGITKVHGYTTRGEYVTINRGDYSYDYRKVEGLDIIITSVEIHLEKADAKKQKTLLEKYDAVRSKQPPASGTAGSIFKNPPGDFAGRLIEQAGMKGYCVGGAMVSPQHANWIINKGKATAGDVLALIEEIKNSVNQKFGILLETEVKIVNPQ